MAYSTFANGGTRYAPQVAAAIVSPSGKVVKRFAPKVTGHVSLPPSTYQALLDRVRAVRSRTRAAPPTAPSGGLTFPGGVAGKTGTADTRARQGAHGLVRGLRARPPTPSTWWCA